MRLVVDGFGKFLGRKGETIVVRDADGNVQRIQPAELEQVIISGKGSISTDALHLLAMHGVDVILMDLRGEVLARLSPPEMKTVSTRREQYKAYDDERGVEFSKEVIYCKIRSQSSLLYSLAKKRIETDPKFSEELNQSASRLKGITEEIRGLQGRRIEELREPLMNLEGRAANAYWQSLSKLFGVDWGFKGRSGRYAEDPVNSLLNYSYGVLMAEVWRAIHCAGLDPYGGFLHADRPGKPSLVLDLMEEFRPVLADRSVIKFVTKRMVQPTDFEMVDGVCQMKDQTRRAFLRELLERMTEETRYKEMKLRWCDLILHQARELAKFLRGESQRFEGFFLRW